MLYPYTVFVCVLRREIVAMPARSRRHNERVCSATTLECHVASKRQDIPFRHIIQIQNRPVVRLSVNADRQSGRHNYLFSSLT